MQNTLRRLLPFFLLRASYIYVINNFYQKDYFSTLPYLQSYPLLNLCRRNHHSCSPEKFNKLLRKKPRWRAIVCKAASWTFPWKFAEKYQNNHCKRSVRIQSFSVRMRENTDQNNSKYWHFSSSKLF